MKRLTPTFFGSRGLPLYFCLTLGISYLGHAADWPQFLGPNRNGVSRETNSIPTWPQDGPKQIWQRNIGQGFSGPVVSSGKLILFHRLGNKEAVVCLDARTGKDIWKFDYPTAYDDDFGFDEGPRATPTIDSGFVYTYGADGALHCLQLADGKKVWNVDCKTTFNAEKGYFGRACSPLVEGELLLINIGGNDGAGIVALNKSTGKLVWKASQDEASYSSPAIASLGGKRLAIFFTRRGLIGLDPLTGKSQFDFFWRARMDASVNAATPLISGDLIFLSASYGTGAVVLRMKPSSVEKVWSSDDALSNHYATSVHHDGFLYGFHGRQEQGAAFRCVELKTGKLRWEKDGLGAGTATLVGNQLLILTEKGELIHASASPDQFKLIQSSQILPFGVRAYPAFANGYLFARSKDKLVCVALRSSP